MQRTLFATAILGAITIATVGDAEAAEPARRVLSPLGPAATPWSPGPAPWAPAPAPAALHLAPAWLAPVVAPVVSPRPVPRASLSAVGPFHLLSDAVRTAAGSIKGGLPAAAEPTWDLARPRTGSQGQGLATAQRVGEPDRSPGADARAPTPGLRDPTDQPGPWDTAFRPPARRAAPRTDDVTMVDLVLPSDALLGATTSEAEANLPRALSARATLPPWSPVLGTRLARSHRVRSQPVAGQQVAPDIQAGWASPVGSAPAEFEDGEDALRRDQLRGHPDDAGQLEMLADVTAVRPYVLGGQDDDFHAGRAFGRGVQGVAGVQVDLSEQHACRLELGGRFVNSVRSTSTSRLSLQLRMRF